MDVSNGLTRSPSPLAHGNVRVSQAPVATFDDRHYGLAKPPHLKFHTVPPIQAHQHVFLNDGNVKASGQSLWEHGYPSPLNQRLVLETGDQADQVHISHTHYGQLNIRVNDQLYHFASHDKEGQALKFHLKTHGGNDNVSIDANVMQPITIETGDGDDWVRAGGGYTRVFGGNGNDVVRLGSGMGYAEGNDGDDIIMGGPGDNVVYGNNGNDRLYAGAGPRHKKSYMDGGNGNDQLYAGNGHTVLQGGTGNDRLIGHDQTTFYTGIGADTVIANRPGDAIYAKASDTIKHLNGSVLTAVSAHDGPILGVVINGSADFIQRVEDDLALLRTSPQGQQMLAEMEAVALRNGAPVTIVEDPSDTESSYVYGSQELKALLQDERAPVSDEDPKWGFMINGVPGSRADRAQIHYNRSHLNVLAGVTQLPIVGLYHEMVHAYNAGNGTTFTGTTQEDVEGQPHDIHNSERQAVGLPTTAQPFDFDNDPATPPTASNPKAFTENALNKEMGRPLRKQYAG